MKDIDGKTAIYLLIGDPVEHSLSPAIHNAAFQSLGHNAVYLASRVKGEQVGQAVRGMRAFSIGGMNVTSPHKEAVVPFLDDLSDEAAALGAVNTIVNDGGRLNGYSTDGRGFLSALEEEAAHALDFRRVVVVGAGGAARSAASSLARASNRGDFFTVLNRGRERGEKLTAGLASIAPRAECRYLPLERETAAASMKDADLIIYALAFDAPSFLEAINAMRPIDGKQILFDLRYHPAKTAVMKSFAAAGGRAVNGLGMLLWQAAAAFELFTKTKAPLEPMRRALGLAD